MNFILKKILFIVLLHLCCAPASGQRNDSKKQNNYWAKPYHESIGLKIGNVFKLDYKHFHNSEISFLVSTGFYLTDQDGLFSSFIICYHHDTHIENLYWYYGGGLGMRNSESPIEIGMSGTIGFEIVSLDKKLNFFVDVQPTAYYPTRKKTFFSSVLGVQELNYYVEASVGVRYIIKAY